jgi:type VI secretion system Hcp family effector
MSRVYLNLSGSKQGLFLGEASRPTQPGRWIAVLSISPAPCDRANGQSSGKRQWTPVKIVKATGPASVQLFRAAATKELLAGVLQFAHMNGDGQETVYRTIHLTGVVVQTVKRARRIESTEIDEITFCFEKISLAGTWGNTKAWDDSWLR